MARFGPFLVAEIGILYLTAYRRFTLWQEKIKPQNFSGKLYVGVYYASGALLETHAAYSFTKAY